MVLVNVVMERHFSLCSMPSPSHDYDINDWLWLMSTDPVSGTYIPVGRLKQNVELDNENGACRL